MKLLHDPVETRALLDRARCDGRRVGLVPTMGALHAGHTSLIARAAAECDDVLVTVFVNPLQFGPNEDFTTYPRTLERDAELAAAAGATVLLAPSVEAMYPLRPVRTTVSVTGVSEPLEGRVRPGHFDGVATVVSKLFAIAGPCRAYFGEKDWQQLAVVRRMAVDLSMPVEIVGCPTVREADGLAMSSRNVYLSPEERARAPVLFAALSAGAAAVVRGERRPGEVEALMRRMIEPVAPLDYAAVVDAATLERVDPLAGTLRLLVAARFGKARLIDNVGVQVP